jgi:peptidylprolyl isomerase
MLKKIIFVSVLLTNLIFANQIVVLHTTQGDIELVLQKNIAPKAVKNFTTHVKNGFYNGIIFHRIIKNFMIQSGDPTGTGRGGHSIWNKPFKDEISSKVSFSKAGILAMANKGANTNGSQFFITTKETPWLNGGYTIFGYVKDKKSYEVVKKLENVKTSSKDKPIENQTIIKAYIKK